MTARSLGIPNASFLILVALTTVAFLALTRSFLMPVFWAAVLATVFHPVQRRYVARMGGRRSLAALATILTIIGVVVAPLFLVGLTLTREALDLHEQIMSGAVDVQVPLQLLRRIHLIASDYIGRVGIDFDVLAQRLSTSAVAIAQFIASRALGIGQDVLRISEMFFLMLYMLLFFLRDSSELLRR